MPLFRENEHLFNICHVTGSFLISHAGVSRIWCENNSIDEVEQINELWRRDPYRLDFVLPKPSDEFSSPADPRGDNVFQGPLWIRPPSLLAAFLPGYHQVVGHTRQKKVTGMNSDEHYFFFIDALEYGSYLVIEDGEAREGLVPLH